MNIQPVEKGNSAAPHGAVALASPAEAASQAASTFHAVDKAVELSRTLQDKTKLADVLSEGQDAAIDAVNQFSAELKGAINDISWLLKALGMKETDVPPATEQVEKAVHDHLAEHSKGASVQIEQTQSIWMEMRDISITVANGNHVAEVHIVSLKFVASSTTTISAQAPAAPPPSPAPAFGTDGKPIDPVVLDLSGDGISLTHPENGKVFDLNGDGRQERTAWVQGDDALLAMDRDNDGAITSGKELFGEANGGADGFEELARLDENQDGIIDAKDSGFGSLLLLHEGGRLDTLESQGITSIRLDLIRPISQQAGEGGRLVAASLFERKDGSTGMVADGLFNVQI